MFQAPLQASAAPITRPAVSVARSPIESMKAGLLPKAERTPEREVMLTVWPSATGASVSCPSLDHWPVKESRWYCLASSGKTSASASMRMSFTGADSSWRISTQVSITSLASHARKCCVTKKG
ncbi:MAG: hypothetical protein BWX70_03277 [Verrucomicrobia bacterium ADurb.Bin070]|nr:MAG: hypothetical protein BWX70_03277 [Verrucomicrobia bacterium ADurb.Bin070]